MKFIIPVIIPLFSLHLCEAQGSLDSVIYLSKEGVTRLTSNKFGNLVTGQPSSTNLINYASFNPIAGTFSFNGSFPVGTKGSSSRFSFLSLKISGDLISDSYAALFQNMKLNTSISISGQWDFRLKKGFHYNYLVSDQFNLNQKKRSIQAQWQENEDRLTNQTSIHTRDLSLLRVQARILDTLSERHKDSLSRMEISLNNFQLTPDSIDRIKLIYDSIMKQKALIEQIENDRWMAMSKADSLQNIISNYRGFIIASRRKNASERDSKIRLIEDSAVISGIKFNWVSLFASTGRTNYYTFDPRTAFSNQIRKLESSTWKVGFVYNSYSERSFPERILLFNIGIFRYGDNNLSFLSTQDVLQETVVKNTSGDTTRKISKTYKAYSDEIASSKVWNFVSNIYFLYSSTKSGFHFYPSIDIYDKGKALTNFGIGYLISFKNAEKDKPIINTEGYVQFQDLTNALEKENNFLKRSEIGVRFALPFSFFTTK